MPITSPAQSTTRGALAKSLPVHSVRWPVLLTTRAGEGALACLAASGKQEPTEVGYH